MTRVDARRARELLDLGRDLGPAAPVSDIVDVLTVGVGAKPMAGVATCFTAAGTPAWDDVAPDARLTYGALGDRLDAVGLDWHLTPIERLPRDGEVTWYELLVSGDRRTLSRFLDDAGVQPSDRTEREYGEALGYPDSAVEWFVSTSVAATDDSVFDVIAERYVGDDAVTLAASVPYVPAPTVRGARDAIDDGRALTEALGRLDESADRDEFAELLLGERVRETLATYDQHRAWRDPLSRAMG
ncbi:hypothetical protein ACFQPA_15560 [Halomarina halobia]|uniref:PAC2 family protein n=1 Tax=Halomarina halobia TaxID=3033386 RepID=A0ABD6A7F2_9EURY|nr:hypothetical protein [Halomarina sp. PSR21]